VVRGHLVILKCSLNSRAALGRSCDFTLHFILDFTVVLVSCVLLTDQFLELHITAKSIQIYPATQLYQDDWIVMLCGSTFDTTGVIVFAVPLLFGHVRARLSFPFLFCPILLSSMIIGYIKRSWITSFCRSTNYRV
jgi:hypothetical protein